MLDRIDSSSNGKAGIWIGLDPVASTILEACTVTGPSGVSTWTVSRFLRVAVPSSTLTPFAFSSWATPPVKRLTICPFQS